MTNDPEALRAIFVELGGEARVALEAAFGWEWLADLLEDEGIELHLAHPRQLNNRVHALLARRGVQQGRAELFGPSGRRVLAGLSLPESTRRRLESLLALVADFERELAAVEREIQARAKDDPRGTVLTRIPGVGVFIALLVIA